MGHKCNDEKHFPPVFSLFICLLFSRNSGTVSDADVLDLTLKELTVWTEANNHTRWQTAQHYKSRSLTLGEQKLWLLSLLSPGLAAGGNQGGWGSP